MTTSITDNLHNKNCGQNIGRNKENKITKNKKCLTKTRKKRNKIKTITFEKDISEDSEDEINTSLEYESETLSESFSDLEAETTTDNKDQDKDITINKEEYYAIYYDTQWYLGRVLEVESEKCKEKCKIKFLKEDLIMDSFVWPKDDDIQEIEKKYIFYGPIKLIGSSPFKIKRADRLIICKSYKNLKRI